MQVRYFVVDVENQLQRVPEGLLRDVWEGRRWIDDLPCEVFDELRIVSVLCDERLLPRITFFARLEIELGQISDQSRLNAYEAMSTPQHRGDDFAQAQHQLSGWPADWQRQLAIALDVVPSQLHRLGLGGPLLMSELWGVSLEKVLQYFELVDRQW